MESDSPSSLLWCKGNIYCTKIILIQALEAFFLGFARRREKREQIRLLGKIFDGPRIRSIPNP